MNFGVKSTNRPQTPEAVGFEGWSIRFPDDVWRAVRADGMPMDGGPCLAVDSLARWLAQNLTLSYG